MSRRDRTWFGRLPRGLFLCLGLGAAGLFWRHQRQAAARPADFSQPVPVRYPSASGEPKQRQPPLLVPAQRLTRLGRVRTVARLQRPVAVAAVTLTVVGLLALWAWTMRPIDAPEVLPGDPGSIEFAVAKPTVGGKAVATTTRVQAFVRLGQPPPNPPEPNSCGGSVAAAGGALEGTTIGIVLGVDVPNDVFPPQEEYLLLPFVLVLAGDARFRAPRAAAADLSHHLSLGLPPQLRQTVLLHEKVVRLDARTRPVQVFTGNLPVYVPSASLRISSPGDTVITGGQLCGARIQRRGYWTVGWLPGLNDQVVGLTSITDLVSPNPAPSPASGSSEFSVELSRWNRFPKNEAVTFEPEIANYDVRVAQPAPDASRTLGLTWSGRSAWDGPRFRLVDLDRESPANNRVFWAGLVLGLAGTVLVAGTQELLSTLRRLPA